MEEVEIPKPEFDHDIVVWDLGGYECSCGKRQVANYGYATSWTYQAMTHMNPRKTFRIQKVERRNN